MSKRTVLKVDTSCAKCKRKVLQAVSALPGVDKIEIDSEKSTMKVTGSVDPVEVVVQTRKAGKRADIVTIGPPPSAKPPEEKKPVEQHQQQKKLFAAAEKKAPEPPVTVYVHHHVPPSWPPDGYGCEQRVVYERDPPPCSIM